MGNARLKANGGGDRGAAAAGRGQPGLLASPLRAPLSQPGPVLPGRSRGAPGAGGWTEQTRLTGRTGHVPRRGPFGDGTGQGLGPEWLSCLTHAAPSPRHERCLNVSLVTGNCVCRGLHAVPPGIQVHPKPPLRSTRRVVADGAEHQDESTRDRGGSQGGCPCKTQKRPQTDSGRKVR